MINERMIDEALEFYAIDKRYRGECYKALDIINGNEEFSNAYKRVNTILYEGNFEKIKKFWNIKDKNQLFCNGINPFVTNIMILSGYQVHRNNMKKYKLDSNQIKIHQKRVKECFESDLISRNYDGVRISQMLWATYFIRIKLIEVGNLQFEYETDFIKIHIPKNTDLNVIKVIESIEESRLELERMHNISKMRYVCNSWLLSNQIFTVLDKDTNIAKFHSLFKVSDGNDCLDDILNFVFNIDECNDYSTLDEKTSLQRIIKVSLLNNKRFYLGVGIFKENELCKGNKNTYII